MDKHCGEVNILLSIEPGTAKTQILTDIQKLALLSVLTTGQGGSGVGLAPNFKRDDKTREWKLELGALIF